MGKPHKMCTLSTRTTSAHTHTHTLAHTHTRSHHTQPISTPSHSIPAPGSDGKSPPVFMLLVIGLKTLNLCQLITRSRFYISLLMIIKSTMCSTWAKWWGIGEGIQHRHTLHQCTWADSTYKGQINVLQEKIYDVSLVSTKTSKYAHYLYS